MTPPGSPRPLETEPHRDTAPRPAKVSRGWKRAFGFGVIFELLLVAATLLPRDSWLVVKLFNLLVLSHSPLLSVMGGIESDVVALLALPVALAVMGAFWGFLFYWSWTLVNALLARLGFSSRQKRLLAYAVVFVCAVTAVVMLLDAWQDTPRPFSPSPAVKSVVEGNTTFALDLYQKLKAEPGNLFFSPYSISSALGMLYIGARGSTGMEIAKTAHFILRQEDVHPAFRELMDRLNKVRRVFRIKLTAVNSLWCQENRRFSDGFLEQARTSYKAEPRQVDFKQAPEYATHRINSWLERETNGKMKGLLRGPVPRDARLILCNAIYFKGRWAQPFKHANTKPCPFFIETNQTVTVPMMYQSSDLKVGFVENSTLKLLELPYYGRDLSMIILLPEAVDGLPELESELSPQKLSSWLGTLAHAEPHKTSVYLPRFRTETSFSISEMLKTLGMPSAFADRADFSGIDGTKQLYLSDALHSALVEVNESGTEAAAATLMVAMSKSANYLVNVDHPFLFLIRDNASGSILFVGRVLDPTK